VCEASVSTASDLHVLTTPAPSVKDIAGCLTNGFPAKFKNNVQAINDCATFAADPSLANASACGTSLAGALGADVGAFWGAIAAIGSCAPIGGQVLASLLDYATDDLAASLNERPPACVGRATRASVKSMLNGGPSFGKCADACSQIYGNQSSALRAVRGGDHPCTCACVTYCQAEARANALAKIK
jgi:hypothetical protein